MIVARCKETTNLPQLKKCHDMRKEREKEGEREIERAGEREAGLLPLICALRYVETDA